MIGQSININVIENSGKPASSKLSKLTITKDGGFDGRWPGGFFEERSKKKG